MHLKGYILLVENDDDVRERFEKLLMLEEYAVFSCFSAERALEICQSQPIDLALIDYRLKDDNNPNDKTGHDLTKQLDSGLVKILMSAFRPNTFGQIAANNTVEFNKNQGPEALLQLVDQLFEEKVQVNHALKIEADFDFDNLIKQIRKFRQFNAQAQLKRRFDLEGLFKRLFFLEKEIRLHRIQPGYGGSGVVRVTPYYSHEEGQGAIAGADVIVKFGKADNMIRELDRYSRYVETFLGMRATDVVGSLKQSNGLAGIKFRLIGSQSDRESSDKVWSFEGAYQEFSAEDMAKVIQDLFQTTCGLWYAGKYQAKQEKRNLAAEYQKHFRLDTDNRLDEVEKIIEQIVDCGDEDRLTVSFFDENHLEFTYGSYQSYPFILFNPLVFIEKYSKELPEIYYRTITHGDLNERNIFIDSNLHTWLIDFFKTGESAALRDVVQLETAVKFFLYREPNLARRLTFEQAVLSPDYFLESIDYHVSGNDNELRKALTVIASIRNEALHINGGEDMKEYYAGMLFNTLRVMTLEDLDSDRINRGLGRVRRKHALFSAALIAQRFAMERN